MKKLHHRNRREQSDSGTEDDTFFDNVGYVQAGQTSGNDANIKSNISKNQTRKEDKADASTAMYAEVMNQPPESTTAQETKETKTKPAEQKKKHGVLRLVNKEKECKGHDAKGSKLQREIDDSEVLYDNTVVDEVARTMAESSKQKTVNTTPRSDATQDIKGNVPKHNLQHKANRSDVERSPPESKLRKDEGRVALPEKGKMKTKKERLQKTTANTSPETKTKVEFEQNLETPTNKKEKMIKNDSDVELYSEVKEFNEDYIAPLQTEPDTKADGSKKKANPFARFFKHRKDKKDKDDKRHKTEISGHTYQDTNESTKCDVTEEGLYSEIKGESTTYESGEGVVYKNDNSKSPSKAKENVSRSTSAGEAKRKVEVEKEKITRVNAASDSKQQVEGQKEKNIQKAKNDADEIVNPEILYAKIDKMKKKDRNKQEPEELTTQTGSKPRQNAQVLEEKKELSEELYDDITVAEVAGENDKNNGESRKTTTESSKQKTVNTTPRSDATQDIKGNVPKHNLQHKANRSDVERSPPESKLRKDEGRVALPEKGKMKTKKERLQKTTANTSPETKTKVEFEQKLETPTNKKEKMIKNDSDVELYSEVKEFNEDYIAPLQTEPDTKADGSKKKANPFARFFKHRKDKKDKDDKRHKTEISGHTYQDTNESTKCDVTEEGLYSEIKGESTTYESGEGVVYKNDNSKSPSKAKENVSRSTSAGEAKHKVEVEKEKITRVNSANDSKQQVEAGKEKENRRATDEKGQGLTQVCHNEVEKNVVTKPKSTSAGQGIKITTGSLKQETKGTSPTEIPAQVPKRINDVKRSGSSTEQGATKRSFPQAATAKYGNRNGSEAGSGNKAKMLHGKTEKMPSCSKTGRVSGDSKTSVNADSQARSAKQQMTTSHELYSEIQENRPIFDKPSLEADSDETVIVENSNYFRV